ncbi:glycosyltransferase [Chitinophaga rhizophila]|uniref:Glycosyltransferase n=1 Tax=Chitinophaga rhizophila TaxID=2866212 RepID=A0ABS7GI24_9BACT|nr:glycosyltransferase [Chitinophaga rhizophila]MBW8687353.1 glycosyltransferase [Chitinophaga rhizophila]
MKLFINAHNLRFGGGRTVGFNIINYYASHPEVSSLVVAVPEGCGYERFAGHGKVKLVVFNRLFNRSLFKIVSNYLVLPVQLAVSRPDYILSLGNVAIPTGRAQFLLVHQPYLAYPESAVWKRIREDDPPFYRYITNMLRLIKANLRYVSVLGVQTEAMKKRLSRLYRIPEQRIVVIPNAVSFTSVSVDSDSERRADEQDIRLLFLSKYYPHKNFEILYEVGKVIIAKQLPLRITVTIDKTENDGSRRFLERIEELGLASVIVNQGNVPLEDIPAVYGQHDGLLLPTFLESFSGTYIEAMHFGRPIFTSNMDFAREVCKDAAYYFDPDNPEDITSVIIEAFNDPQKMKNKVIRGKELMQQAKTWDDIGKFIDTSILKIAK